MKLFYHFTSLRKIETINMKLNLLKSLITILALFCVLQSHAQWVPVASPPSNFITDHTYGFALDGKGYLVAGINANGQVTNSFFEYDPVVDEFTRIGNFPGFARGFAIGDTWDGKAYFGFGASTNRFDDLWVYDPAVGEWEQLASCPCEERIHPAMVAHNGKVYVGLGGGQLGDLDDWWIYDIETDTWEVGPRFPGATRHHPYQFGIGDFIYVGFGHGGPNIYNEWYRYDPANEVWDEVATLPAQGRVAGQQFAWEGKGYILSGEGEQHSTMETGEFWSYDPELDEWEELPPHPGNSRWAPASFVLNDEVYLFNGIVRGNGPNQSMSDAYKYDLTQTISSTSDEIDNLDLTIQPNPTSDFITLDSDDNEILKGKFSVFDHLGKEVLQFTLNGSERINVSHLDNGVYILTSQDKNVTRQFVVSR
jgi:N-acetylneuraminic acid mutarotase